MKEPEEIIYDKFQIFFKDRSTIFTLPPRSYNRKEYKILGKFFAELIKELKAKSK